MEPKAWTDADGDTWLLLSNGRVTISFLQDFCEALIERGELAGAPFEVAEESFGPLVPVTES